MATLSTQSIVRSGNGLTPTYAAVTGGGDACEVGDDIFLHFKNTNAATYTPSIAIPAAASTYPGVVYTPLTAIIPATTGDKMIGPISNLFRDPTTGLAQITYTGTTTNGTVACVKLQAP